MTLLSGACAWVNQADVKVKDEKAARLVKEGAKLYDEREYDEALKKLSEAEEHADLSEDKKRIAEIIFKGGFTLLEKKLFDTALSYYNRSLEINKTLDNKPGLVNNYSYIAKVYAEVGKYEEGIEFLQKALKAQKELDDKTGIAHNLSSLAGLYSYLGDYRRPIKLLNRALEIGEEIGDRGQTARTLIYLATINNNLRNYQTSIDYLNRAFEIAEEENEESLKAGALNLMGVVYRQQGDYEKALDSYRMALKINRKSGLKTETALTLSAIGELYKELGRYDEALKYLRESLNISETLKDKLITAANLNYIGEVRYKQGSYGEALNLYNTSLGKFQELGFRDGIARSYNNIGYVKGETGDWDGAIQNFDRALEIYRDLGDRVWIYVSLFGKAVYLEKKGDRASAEKNYKEAVDVFESIREDVAGGAEAEGRFSDVNAQIYENLVSLLLRSGKKEEALEYVERSRSKALRDIFLKNGITSSDEKTRGLLERFDELFKRDVSVNRELVREKSKPLPNLEKIENLTETLAETAKEFKQVTSELKTDHPEIYSLLSIQPGTLLDPEQRDKLPEDTVFVEYFITEKETYIFLISEKDLIVRRVSIMKKELNALVTLFRDLIYTNKSIPTDNWQGHKKNEYRQSIEPLKNISTLLYHYLIQPVENEIQGAETVALVPFGSLHYLPFHALAQEDADGGLEFFIEKKKLIYLVSASAGYLDAALRNGIEDGIGRVAAFGNPDLGEPELVLPYSEDEVIAIKEMFPDASVFLKKDATKVNFKSSWGKHEIVHLAAHGLIQEEPSILLAPLGSGSLNLSDITGLPPAGKTHLVVLSACEAAVDNDEDNPTGAKLNSIAMAFTIAGAPSVIATLWRVDDRATYELMKSFYKHLKAEEQFDYEALRKAQLAMLNRTDRYGQPFYWAPFIFMGVWNNK